MSSRLLSDLTPECEKRARLFLGKCAEKGLPVFVTCTARSYTEQVALYSQGRQPLEEVNTLRALAALYLLKSEEENIVVTWTLVSNHIVHLEDTDATNDKSRAFDIAFLKDGKLVYDIKVVAKKEDLDSWEKLGALGESCGLTWGGRWKKPDRPHFQYTG